MAKATINILCPSGHRRKAQMTPNSNLLQVLEDMCNQESLDSSEWGLIHQRKKCDLTIPWRLLSIPTNALLEMFKLEERRAISNVTIQLQLPDNSRSSGSFNPSITLQEMLDWYRKQSESTITAFDTSMNNGDKVYPVCSYMSEEIVGDYALSNTTLRQLGLTSGTAVIRYNYRSITDEELKKIKDSIDDKIARRQQTIQPAPVHTSPPVTTVSNPPPPVTTISAPSQPITTTSAPSFKNEEFSIFRDRERSIFGDPPASHSTATTSQQQSRTLAEALGINISFDQHPTLQQQQQQNQIDFSNFKFPEATKGQNLDQTKSSNNSQHIQNSTSCDRHIIAYDLTNIPSTSQNKSEELPDSFFELTPEDLRSVLTTLRQQGAEENPLETRSMRERIRSTRNVTYEYVAIRFVINSNYILQGLFYPNETISDLMEFARTNLIFSQLEKSDFYLYISPPRIILSDLNKTLSSYDLIPAAYIYIGHRKISPLIIQLKSNISIETINKANDIVTQYVFNRRKFSNDNETNINNQSTKRNSSMNNIDNKNLRDKVRKFLPGQK